MSTCSLLISIAIMALVSAGAVFLVPVLNEREVAVEVAEIQAAAAAFREAKCADLPAAASLDVIGVPNLSSGVADATWVVRFPDFPEGQGMIDATIADERLGSMIARAGGGERVGNVTSIPVRRPAALDRTSPEAHQIRRYFAGATMC